MQRLVEIVMRRWATVSAPPHEDEPPLVATPRIPIARDPWLQRKMVPLSEFDLGSYDILRPNPGLPAGVDEYRRHVVEHGDARRHVVELADALRLVDCAGANVWCGLSPCSSSCGACCELRRGTPETASEQFERLYDVNYLEVVEVVAERLLAVPWDPVMRAARAYIVQRILHDQRYEPTGAQRGRVLNKKGIMDVGVFTRFSAASALPLVTKVVNLPKVLNGVLESNSVHGELVEMYNELIVSLFAINRLTTRTPNFRGALALHFGPGSRKTAFDSPDAVGAYLLLEAVDGTTFADMARSGSEMRTEDAVSVLLQVLLSLSIARDECEFAHNDLHMHNVMVEKLPAPRRITYKLRDNFVLTLVTTWVARIIDYGYAHVKIPVSGEFLARYEGGQVPRFIDTATRTLRTGPLSHRLNIAPSGPNSLGDVARCVSAWAMSVRHLKDVHYNSVLRWVLGPLFKTNLPSVDDLRTWAVNLYAQVPPGIDIDPLEYTLALLDAPRPGGAFTLDWVHLGEGPLAVPPLDEHFCFNGLPGALSEALSNMCLATCAAPIEIAPLPSREALLTSACRRARQFAEREELPDTLPAIRERLRFESWKGILSSPGEEGSLDALASLLSDIEVWGGEP